MPALLHNDFVELVMVERTASVERNTLETQIKASINPVKLALPLACLFLSTCSTRSPAMG